MIVAYVEWGDAGVVTSSWDDRTHALDVASEMIAKPIRSAGLLVEELADYIVLAGGCNEVADDLNLVMVIPRACIRRLDKWEPEEKA